MTTDAQIAVLDAEHERLRAQGPDFTGYHTGSEFREPPAHNITREDRIKILVQFDGIRAGLYKHCRSERGQAVSYNYRQVLGVLLSFAVKRGRVFPSRSDAHSPRSSDLLCLVSRVLGLLLEQLFLRSLQGDQLDR